jgi:hypothetical protein
MQTHRRLFLAVFTLAALLAGTLLGAPAAVADSTAKTALILGSSVSGSPSLEEQKLVELGYTVTVVDDATWSAMTAAQFAGYRLLVHGDPFCSTEVSPAFVSSAPVWAPVVMGTAGGSTKVGNRTLIGTDPVFHQSQGDAPALIKDGLNFAGAIVGATGVYFDATCDGYGGDGTDVLSVLERLTIDPGKWTTNNTPPCGGAIAIIASNAMFSDLEDADLEGWGCSVHETYPTFPTDWSALVVATDTPTAPTCGTDPNTGQSACGEAYVLLAGGGVVTAAPNISLTPLTATNPVNTTHTVTATVTNGDGSPLVGQLVSFVVTGANAGASGTCSPASCMTDSTGKVTFTYTGTNVGDDTINASFTKDGSTQKATAAKTWTASASHGEVVCTGYHGETYANGATIPAGSYILCTGPGKGTWVGKGSLKANGTQGQKTMQFKTVGTGAGQVVYTPKAGGSPITLNYTVA